MKSTKNFIYLLLAAFTLGCDKTPAASEVTAEDKAPTAFEMTVEGVEELNGLVLKGVAVWGTVSDGCIAEGTPFIIYRDNKKVLEDKVRILSVSKNGNNKPPNGEAIKKEFATFYIPDIDIRSIVAGDVINASVVTCRKTSLAQLK